MTERERKERVLGLSIWRRGEGNWYADLRPVGGPSKKSLGTSDRTEAEENLAEEKNKLEAEKELTCGNPKLADFAQRYLDRMESEDTVRNLGRS